MTEQATRELDDKTYLEQVRREIDEEVRRRRAAGEFPPSFERKLEELFARFTPTGTHDDRFTEALKLADRSAYFDTQVPFGSRREPKGFTKWVLWQAEAWFVNYVVRQLNHFSSSVMRVVHLLDERLSEVEREVEMLVEPALPEEEAISKGADPAPFFQLLSTRLSAPGTPQGRILHAECGDGSLLEALSEADLDVYGIDPGTPASDAAVRKGLDVRRDEVLGHLGSIAEERLAGLVLSGCVDRMSVSERRRLLQLAEMKVAPGATVAIVLISPSNWREAVGPVVADLAPSGPWNPETWAHLLQGLGFGAVSIFRDASDLSGTPGAPGAAAGEGSAPEETAPAKSFCVCATKARGPANTGGR